MSSREVIVPSLRNPLCKSAPDPDDQGPTHPYEAAMGEAARLRRRPYEVAGENPIARQHKRGRMTVWERVSVLSSEPPEVLFSNWGPNLDGASLVTAVVRIHGRDVAVYGHDFTIRAGSMDATNGRKLARLFELAGEKGIPVIGMNDSAGAFVPAGVGGLDGYAEAFTALRRISGVVPSIMCMFGFNAGGGSYLPRQGSFVIQPKETFFGLTGPGVVKSVLGEDVTPEELGGPGVHGQSGVVDFTVEDEVAALRIATQLLSYLPSHNSELAPFRDTSDPHDRVNYEIDRLLKIAFTSPTGFNTPFDVRIMLQQMCDYGDYFEIQAQRAPNTVTAFGRMGGQVVGFIANNSAFSSGQIDIDAAYKNARFCRFCNLFNIPVIFIEDTTGFLPGKDQETRGIVQAGRAMLDSIIDLRTPRILLIVRNAFGGAYASFNNYSTGADAVFALPSTRVAVMGPAGAEFVYKNEIRAVRAQAPQLLRQVRDEALAKGTAENEAEAYAKEHVDKWLQEQMLQFQQRYEKELMNPREALSLGSISRIIMPGEVRGTLVNYMSFLLRHYQPAPLSGPQREFH